MTSSHSMYKHPSKIAKATPLQKTTSKFQRKVNFLEKEIKKHLFNLQIKNIMAKQFQDLVRWAIKEKRITKQECSRFIKRKKEIKQQLEDKASHIK